MGARIDLPSTRHDRQHARSHRRLDRHTFKNYVAGEGDGTGTVYTITMSVADQQDRIFSGTLYITNSTQVIVYNQAFAGAIGPDGKTLTIVQSDGSYTTGTYTAPDQVEWIYALSGENYDVAIDTLKKT